MIDHSLSVRRQRREVTVTVSLSLPHEDVSPDLFETHLLAPLRTTIDTTITAADSAITDAAHGKQTALTAAMRAALEVVDDQHRGEVQRRFGLDPEAA